MFYRRINLSIRSMYDILWMMQRSIIENIISGLSQCCNYL